MIRHTIDSGTAWARGWFAKPVATGSIPATVSIFHPLYNERLWGRGHRFQLGQSLGEWFIARRRGPFLEGVKQGARFPHKKALPDPTMEHLGALVILHRDAEIAAKTALSETRDKLIAAQKELSAVKRRKETP